LQPEVKAVGTVVTTSGEVVGEHDGVVNYTIGQRARLPASGDGARFVTRIDAATNTIVIGRDDELLSDELVGDEVNLIRPERFASDGVPVRAMIRYRATPTAAVATISSDGRLRLRFDEPQRAVSPGQLVALLDPTSDEVLGAATIAIASP
jgi:tRNA-specific 2-thiouridylase